MSDFNETVIAGAIDYIVALHGDSVPDLDQIASRFGYESTHFQKLFKSKVGLSPKKFAQYMHYTRARDLLLRGHPTLEAAYQSGLSSAGRLHDLFVSIEAATPGMVKRRGEGVAIFYGYHPTPLGDLLIGCTKAGVCWLGFSVDEDRSYPFEKMRHHWPKASFMLSPETTAPAAEQILRIWHGQGEPGHKLALDLHGTNFQVQVWRALLKIPCGSVVSYQHVAEALGDPKASRAVGTAVGKNPVSLLIPCHRVIQKSGIVENYAWGTARKKAILFMESMNCGFLDGES